MNTIQQLKTGALIGATQIKISEELTTIPDELYQHADTLEILDLSGNELTELPNAFSCLKKLRILFLSNNKFEVFPGILNELPVLDIVGFKANNIRSIPEKSLPVSLRWLILTDNRIEKLPSSIGLCVKLQKVMLAGNKLNTLPDAMASCRNIELLRISANQITILPTWLLTLPKLAWLAFAGNPCCYKFEELQSLSTFISWNKISLQEQLGQGASGVIYKAILKDKLDDVAVKIYKGAVTSDGFPSDEMKACLQAGDHSNLVVVKGIITDQPDAKEGLVMELISSDYINLGLPPNFITCTRDTFYSDTFFTANAIIDIVKGIASAVSHLHKRGVVHGDLYAHNILVNKLWHPLLGDFGAATIFSVDNDLLARSLEKLEVRAFGCLLEDLLNRVVHDNVSEIDYLFELKNQCLNENIESRPTFETILEALTL